MAKFLTQAWFDEVARLNEEAGDLNLPPNLANLIININITGDNPTQFHLSSGKLKQHHNDDATSTINIDNDTLSAIIKSGANASETALEAFMTGKIRIDGDMSQVLALQTAKPSPEQKQLYKTMKGMTEF
ncbi:MAG: SCP2 sterol-binding domain-containing protein [Moraxella sp.]|nr:SCP2 sterol-binding domain-containing protein [Moraxella sp.]